MKFPFSASRSATATLIMLGLNAIALVVLVLVLIDHFSATPVAAVPVAVPQAANGPGLRLVRPLIAPLNGPVSIAIQAGHWKNEELPRELRHLIRTTGAEVQHVEEFEINKSVADALARRLRRAGYTAEVLPATVPAGLRVDLFLSIHCDWAERPKNRGWKLSPPQKPNQASRRLAKSLETSFSAETAIRRDIAAISDNMYDYYAFNDAKYEHAIDPLTPAVIVELGFMSNPEEFDRLRREPDWYAGILERGILSYLANTRREDLLQLVPPP
jgi:N-acetylmuramoyl-L-alanine amidase